MRMVNRIAPVIIAAAVCALSAPASAQHGLAARPDQGQGRRRLLHDGQTTATSPRSRASTSRLPHSRTTRSALKALIAGELDSFEGGPQGAFAADAQGRRRRILGCHWVVVPHGIYARERHQDGRPISRANRSRCRRPIPCPTCWRARRSPNTASADDVKLAALGGDNDRYQALIGGVVEAAVVSNEYRAEAPKNIHLLVAGPRRGAEFPARLHDVERQDSGRERGDDAAHFLAAEMNALHFALTHRAEAVALTQQFIHAKPDDPRPASSSTTRSQHHAVDPTLPLPTDKFAWVQDQMVKAGNIKEPLDLKTVTAPEVREKALKLSRLR